jgi:signal transduction histidine kinase
MDGKLVRLEVQDEGAGIAPEQQTLIFEKFYRVDEGRSREHGGTGLGLALVSQCMRALGSEMQLESQIGKGSRFWFHLQEVTSDLEE